MKYNKYSRRMFLQGTGGLLVSSPLLTSLLSKEAQATCSDDSRTRFIALSTPNYFSNRYYSPSQAQVDSYGSPLELGKPYMKVPLSTVFQNHGNVGEVLNQIRALDSKFTSFADQLTIVRGLDMPGRTDHGRPSLLGNLAATVQGRSHLEITANYTIDEFLADSSNFYPCGRPSAAILRLGETSLSTASITDSSGGRDFSGANGRLSFGGNLRSIFNNYLVSVPNGGTSTANPRKRVVDLIFQDFQNTLNGSAIGASDRVILQEHMDGLSDLSKSLESGVQQISCDPGSADIYPNIGTRNPTLYLRGADQGANPSLGNNGAAAIAEYYSKMVQLLTIAIKCNVTQIATIGVTSSIADGVGEGHDDDPRFWHVEYAHKSNHTKVNKLNKWVLDNIFLELMKGLNVQEGSSGETYLDRTMIYFSPECSYGHSGENAGAIIAGGANGRINSGNFYDYTDPAKVQANMRMGLPINRLWVALLRGLGLPPSDYEFNAEKGNNRRGFGYHGDYRWGFEQQLGWLDSTDPEHTSRSFYPGFGKRDFSEVHVPIPGFLKT